MTYLWPSASFPSDQSASSMNPWEVAMVAGTEALHERNDMDSP